MFIPLTQNIYFLMDFISLSVRKIKIQKFKSSKPSDQNRALYVRSSAIFPQAKRAAVATRRGIFS
jgi:hypothetical protein